MQEIRMSIHTSAAFRISKDWAWQAKNYDLKHKGTLLYIVDKVMQLNAWAAQRKGNS